MNVTSSHHADTIVVSILASHRVAPSATAA
jgi:hypothetical protein